MLPQRPVLICILAVCLITVTILVCLSASHIIAIKNELFAALTEFRANNTKINAPVHTDGDLDAKYLIVGYDHNSDECQLFLKRTVTEVATDVALGRRRLFAHDENWLHGNRASEIISSFRRRLSQEAHYQQHEGYSEDNALAQLSAGAAVRMLEEVEISFDKGTDLSVTVEQVRNVISPTLLNDAFRTAFRNSALSQVDPDLNGSEVLTPEVSVAQRRNTSFYDEDIIILGSSKHTNVASSDAFETNIENYADETSKSESSPWRTEVASRWLKHIKLEKIRVTDPSVRDALMETASHNPCIIFVEPDMELNTNPVAIARRLSEINKEKRDLKTQLPSAERLAFTLSNTKREIEQIQAASEAFVEEASLVVRREASKQIAHQLQAYLDHVDENGVITGQDVNSWWAGVKQGISSAIIILGPFWDAFKLYIASFIVDQSNSRELEIVAEAVGILLPKLLGLQEEDSGNGTIKFVENDVLLTGKALKEQEHVKTGSAASAVSLLDTPSFHSAYNQPAQWEQRGIKWNSRTFKHMCLWQKLSFGDALRRLTSEATVEQRSTAMGEAELPATGSTDEEERAYIAQTYGNAKPPNDTLLPEQWYFQDLDALNAWELRKERHFQFGTEETEVIVMVADTGCDIEHPEYKNRLWQNPGEIADNGIDDDNNGYIDDFHGFNFQAGDTNFTEQRVHGTSVAGPILAESNNNFGIAGLCPSCRLLCARIGVRSFHTGAFAEAMNYAVGVKANVVNFSGNGPDSGATRTALANARAGDIVVVVSAGNEGCDLDDSSDCGANYGYPAKLREDFVLSVGASRQDKSIPGYSNFGRESVDLFAPSGILMPLPHGEFDSFSGTSFSAPVVAGVVGLIRSSFPELTAAQVVDTVRSTCRHYPAFEGKAVCPGIVDVPAALSAAGRLAAAKLDVAEF